MNVVESTISYLVGSFFMSMLKVYRWFYAFEIEVFMKQLISKKWDNFIKFQPFL